MPAFGPLPTAPIGRLFPRTPPSGAPDESAPGIKITRLNEAYPKSQTLLEVHIQKAGSFCFLDIFLYGKSKFAYFRKSGRLRVLAAAMMMVALVAPLRFLCSPFSFLRFAFMKFILIGFRPCNKWCKNR